MKLWSYADLMSLRVIYWLRQRKTTERGAEIPRTSMPVVRRALKALRDLDLAPWHAAGPTLSVNGAGEVYVKEPHRRPETLAGQLTSDVLDLVAPFSTAEGTRGPDLLRPRPELRILPGKVSGAPHIVSTRLEREPWLH